MIFLSPDEQSTGLTPRAPPEPTPPDQPSPPLGETVSAAFGLENDVVNVFDLLTRPTFTPDPAYNPIDDPAVMGTSYETNYLDNFVGSQSEAESRSIMARIDRENRQRQTMAQSGIPGVIAGLAAGALSPLMLIPLGSLGRFGTMAVRMGLESRLARAAIGGVEGAAKGAAISVPYTALHEGLLQGTQETRTWDETKDAFVWGALGSAALGAVVGGACGT